MSENEKELAGEETVEETKEEESIEETPTDWEAEAKKARRMAQRYHSQLIKAREVKKEPDDLDELPEERALIQPKKGELDDTSLLFLTVKGIENQEEIELVKKFAKDTGRSVKDIVSNKVFQSELAELRLDQMVKNATPTATKRGGQPQDNLTVAIARYEQTGKLPDDFELKSQVVNYLVEKDGGNKPAWRK
jgi:hypothetical protein